MPKQNLDPLIALIASLSKSEKRSFKLFAKKSNGSLDEMKFIMLFDVIDKSKDYSDELVLTRLKAIKKSQLSNLKAHLYKQILASLRAQYTNKIQDIEIHEQIDYARILYTKGFFRQALKILEKVKLQAEKYHSNVQILDILNLEKRIELQFITRSIESRAEFLSTSSNEMKNKVNASIAYSNLSLKLYSLYLKVGFVKNEKDYLYTKHFFKSNLPETKEIGDFYEQLYKNNAFVWYHYITQDFLMCYKYASRWVGLFENEPAMIEVEMDMYFKGVHNLLNTLFNLRHHEKYNEVLSAFELMEASSESNDNQRMLFLMYLYTAKINKHFLEGSFVDAIELVPEIETFIQEFEGKLDDHRILVFYYKIACIYFGNGDNKLAIDYLNKIIQFKGMNLREDIQCFARILNLIAHFELGNDDLVAYQVRSVYRFLIKMDDLHGVQKEVLGFIRNLPLPTEVELKRQFKILRSKLLRLLSNPYEKRPFLYLDIISWLECKIEGTPVKSVISEKFKEELSSGNRLYFPVKKS
jgi:hypothetical protein